MNLLRKERLVEAAWLDFWKDASLEYITYLISLKQVLLILVMTRLKGNYLIINIFLIIP